MAEREVRYKIDVDVSRSMKQLQMLDKQVKATARSMKQATAASRTMASGGFTGPTTNAAGGRSQAYQRHLDKQKQATAEAEQAQRRELGRVRRRLTSGITKEIDAAKASARSAERLAVARDKNAAVLTRVRKKTERMATSGLVPGGRMGSALAASGIGSGLAAAGGLAGKGLVMAGSGLKTGFRMFQSGVKTFSSALTRFQRSIFSFKTMVVGYLGLRFVKGLSNVASDFQGSVIQLQKLGDAYRRQGFNMPGGGELARDVYQQAIETPFEAKDILEGTRRLMAFQISGALGQRSQQAGTTTPVGRVMGASQDLAATFGRSVAEITELMGRLSTGEAVGLSLRSLSRFGILRKDIQREDPSIQFKGRGELVYDPRMVQQYGIAQARAITGMKLLAAATSAIEREFGGMSQERMKEFRTRMQNMGDAWEKAVIPAGDLLNQYLSPIVLRITERLEKMQPQITKAAESFIGFASSLSGLIPGLETERQKKFAGTEAGKIAEKEQEIAALTEGQGSRRGVAGMSFWGNKVWDKVKGGAVGIAAEITGNEEWNRKATRILKLSSQKEMRMYSRDQLDTLLARPDSAYLGLGGGADKVRSKIRHEIERRESRAAELREEIAPLREAERARDANAVLAHKRIQMKDKPTQDMIRAEAMNTIYQARGVGPISQAEMNREYARVRHNTIVKRRNAYRKAGRKLPFDYGASARQSAGFVQNNIWYGVPGPTMGDPRVQGAFRPR